MTRGALRSGPAMNCHDPHRLARHELGALSEGPCNPTKGSQTKSKHRSEDIVTLGEIHLPNDHAIDIAAVDAVRRLGLGDVHDRVVEPEITPMCCLRVLDGLVRWRWFDESLAILWLDVTVRLIAIKKTNEETPNHLVLDRGGDNRGVTEHIVCLHATGQRPDDRIALPLAEPWAWIMHVLGLLDDVSAEGLQK